jgi:hypothetical protein
MEYRPGAGHGLPQVVLYTVPLLVVTVVEGRPMVVAVDKRSMVVAVDEGRSMVVAVEKKRPVVMTIDEEWPGGGLRRQGSLGDIPWESRERPVLAHVRIVSLERSPNCELISQVGNAVVSRSAPGGLGLFLKLFFLLSPPHRLNLEEESTHK